MLTALLMGAVGCAGNAAASSTMRYLRTTRATLAVLSVQKRILRGARNLDVCASAVDDETGSEADLCSVWPRGVRYRARVMYDGAEFIGMQQQPSGKSVACAIETTLSRRVGCRVAVSPAGRTDTGVHARGQAIHFDLPLAPESSDSSRPARRLPTGEELQRSLNAMLPPALRLSEVELAPESDERGRRWHARRWATGKLYSYRLHAGHVFDPLERRQRYHVGHRPLDTAAMVEAAEHMQGGAIDCACFANRRAGEPLPIEHDVALTTRTVRSIDVVDEGDGRTRIDFHLQSALYKMVRNMVGLLVEVGQGRRTAADVAVLISSRDRSRLPPPAPAHGLTLESVFYAEGWEGKHSHPLHPVGSETRESSSFNNAGYSDGVSF